ncbi:hypothetical protein C2E23DRAFT_823182 [Lenzites betulinus]|nr:hypothetical protein C2E23DRAFT_823182 [Lenzites betulinus]
MGHQQAYLIARVRPHGARPTSRAAIYFVALASQKDNAAVIRYELRAIQGKYGRTCEPLIPDIPCPFALSLLHRAWCLDLAGDKDGAVANTLPASFPFWGNPANVYGITIIDITDPENPAYIFVDHPENILQLLIFGQRYPKVPQNAWRYLTKYCNLKRLPDDHPTKQVILDTIGAMDGIPLITANQLLEAWPDIKLNLLQYVLWQIWTWRWRMPQVAQSFHGLVASRANRSLGTAVKHLVDSGETNFGSLEWLSGKMHEVKTSLRSLQPWPDNALALLEYTLRELGEVTRVDLSGFQLSAKQVSHIVTSLGNVSYLDISENQSLQTSDVVDIVSAAPSLRRLVMMECPSVGDTDLRQAVIAHPAVFSGIEGILHPAFLATEPATTYPIGFAIRCQREFADNNNIRSVWTPFLTPAQAVQVITDTIPWTWRWPGGGTSWGFVVAHVIRAALGAATRAPAQPWEYDTVSAVARITGWDAPPGVPLIPIDPAQRVLWTFYCCYRGTLVQAGEWDRWAFVRYVRDDAPPASDTAATAARPTYTGTVHDLAGYLACMESEGRPMPAPEAVQTLQALLLVKHPRTGKLLCPMLEADQVPSLFADVEVPEEPEPAEESS